MKGKWKKYLIILGGLFIVGLTYAFITISLDKLRWENKRELQDSFSKSLANKIQSIIFDKMFKVSDNLSKSPILFQQIENSFEPDRPEAITVLNTTKKLLNAQIVFLMDQNGTVLACSPYGKKNKTLTGKNYHFRPYFKNAMKGKSSFYGAVGATTNKRGLYFASPVYSNSSIPIGAIVIKLGLERLDKIIAESSYPMALMSKDGIIFSSNQTDWLYKSAFSIAEKRKEEIIATKQFAKAKLESLPYNLKEKIIKIDGKEHSVVIKDLDLLGQNWKLAYIEPNDINFALKELHRNIFLMTLSFMFLLLCIIGYLIYSMVLRKNQEKILLYQKENLEKLNRDNEHAVRELRDVINKATDTSQSLAAASEESAAAIHEMKSNIDEVNTSILASDSEVNLTNYSMSEIKKSIESVTELFTVQSQSLKESAQAINEISDSINSLTQGSQEIERVVQVLETSGLAGGKEMTRTTEIITKVGESAHLIMEMITVINHIAEQTNLLAMNAAIEAAHAGEYGKGFAVVADEIRKLAEDTSKNSSEISNSLKEVIDYIHASEESINNTSNFFSQIIENIKSVSQQILDVNNNMKELTNKNNKVMSSLEQLVDVTKQVQDATHNMNDKVSEISLSMINLRAVQENNKESMEQIVGAINELYSGAESIAQSGQDNYLMVSQLKDVSDYFEQEKK